MANLEVVKRNRRQVVIMIIALPLMVLFGVYSLIYLAQQETLRHTTNLGEFVEPPVLARDLGLTDAVGEPVDGSRHWWVWVAVKDCATVCRQALHHLAQLPELLAEQAAHMRLALVLTKPGASPGDERSVGHRIFTSEGEKTLADGIYVVDPAGNVILRYELTANAMPVAQDLKKMLKVSDLG